MINVYKRRKFLQFGLSLGLLFRPKALLSCTLTSNQPKGPFYKKNYSKSIYDLTNNGKALGTKIQISGRVMDKNCKPFKYSKIKIWQANTFGKYNHANDLSKNKIDKNFIGYTSIKTNADGFYSIFTIIPGPYNVGKRMVRPPHIHFSVITENNKLLDTQLYFKDHALNADDFLFKLAKNKKTLELSTKTNTNSILKGNFNLIL